MDNYSMEINFQQVFKMFKFEGEFLRAERYGAGHINDTFVVYVSNASVRRYILQRINSKLFTNVPALMNNICLVTKFNKEVVLASGGDPDREVLTIIETTSNQPYYFDGVDYFRAYVFIENATSYQVVEKPEHFYESAVAFGNFAKMLARFDATLLYDVLPEFHNTRIRYENLLKAIVADKMGRANSVADEIEFAKAHEFYVDIIVSKLNSGEIPLKVTHNDTKLNNVMIDDVTGKGVAVIDLDTIMAGTICYDFGDSIRFGCNPTVEGNRDLSKVVFQLPLFEAYAEGYLTTLQGTICKAEKDHLAVASIIMTLECGIRFLTDYLEGDTYFRVSREGQNLYRCRTQFKLVSDMELVLDKMKEIINKF